ncbi:hypothetical protein [Alicyclobacillus pomorum]|uniref:hypothetical protein n=1 Tax=Alicyclobacillus pomorum TaxID=204470 RepID=UPI0004192CD5|nr:hypothetical protein [Alicyclobacillus pomorum]
MKMFIILHPARQPEYRILSWNHRHPSHVLAMQHRKPISKRRKFRAFLVRVPFWKYISWPFTSDAIAAGTLSVQQSLPDNVFHPK